MINNNENIRNLIKEKLEEDSFKHILLNNNEISYIPNWDFSAVLDLADATMLCYLIDNDDFKHAYGGWCELTPGYIRGKRPAWKDYSIRNSLKSLTDLGYITKKDGNEGRGNFYKLNLDKIIDDLIMPFLNS